MKWEEFRVIHPHLPESSDGFHQHANGGGWVKDTAEVEGDAYVDERSLVYGNARVYGDAQVSGNARVSGGDITGGTIDRTPLLIFGSQYWIGFSRPGHIASGCIEQPVEWWLENVERCAEEHGYSEAEQQEYRLHVEHIVAWMKLHGLLEPETETAAEAE